MKNFLKRKSKPEKAGTKIVHIRTEDEVLEDINKSYKRKLLLNHEEEKTLANDILTHCVKHKASKKSNSNEKYCFKTRFFTEEDVQFVLEFDASFEEIFEETEEDYNKIEEKGEAYTDTKMLMKTGVVYDFEEFEINIYVYWYFTEDDNSNLYLAGPKILYDDLNSSVVTNLTPYEFYKFTAKKY